MVFNAKASVGCLHLQIASICPGHRLAFKNHLCNVHTGFKTAFFAHLVILAFGPQISEMLQ